MKEMDKKLDDRRGNELIRFLIVQFRDIGAIMRCRGMCEDETVEGKDTERAKKTM